MKPVLPVCSSRTALHLLSEQIPNLDAPEAFVRAAVAIALHDPEETNQCAKPNVPFEPSSVIDQLDGFAKTIQSRVRGTQQQALLAHLHEYLFEELAFSGNAEDYYSPANSYLPSVLRTRKGLPITLSLIYKHVATRLGLVCHGIGLPGHFMVAVETADTAMLVDPFNGGRILTADEAQDMVRDSAGPEVDISEEMFHPVTNLQWITRMLQNLLHSFGDTSRYSDVAAMLEMEMLLWPKQRHLQRDLALVLARVGRTQAAHAWLTKYLNGAKDDPQRDDLLQLLTALRD